MPRFTHPWEPLLHRRDLLRRGCWRVGGASARAACCARDRRATRSHGQIGHSPVDGRRRDAHRLLRPQAGRLPRKSAARWRPSTPPLPGVRFTEVDAVPGETGPSSGPGAQLRSRQQRPLSQPGLGTVRPQGDVDDADHRGAERRRHRLEAARSAGRLPGLPGGAGHDAPRTAALQPVRRRLARPRIRSLPHRRRRATRTSPPRCAEAAEDEFNQQALQAAAGDGRAAFGRSPLAACPPGVRPACRRGERSAEALSRQYQGAFAMLTAPAVRRAFDLEREPEPTRDRYGKTKIGQRCLLARRLVEAGARFVMVDYGYDPEYGNLWDNHAAPVQHQPHICEMAKRPYHLAGTDRAFAALLDDLAVRGRLDETLVVFLTEFGRTPTINSLGRPRSLGRGRLDLLRRRRHARRPGHRRHRQARRQCDDTPLHAGRRGRHHLPRPGYRPADGRLRSPGPANGRAARRGADTRVGLIDRIFLERSAHLR